MRAPSRMSIRFLATSVCCAALAFVVCGGVRAQETKKNNDRIKELQQNRLALLVEARDIAVASLFRNVPARYEDSRYEDFRSLETDLLTARLASVTGGDKTTARPDNRITSGRFPFCWYVNLSIL